MKFTHYLLFFTVLVLFMVCEGTAQNQTLDCKCGRKNDHSFRIVGGKEAAPNSYPWIAALIHRWFKLIFCGGALINDRYVITAAHCVKLFPRQINVILGLHDAKEKHKAEEFRLENVLMHEDYKDNGVNDINDIALLKLKKKVTFSDKIRPVCLPTNTESSYSDVVAQVAGWGKTAYKGGKASPVLKETDLRVISQDKCKQNIIIKMYLLNSMLCAYQDKTDTCQGDSGGPLTYESSTGKNTLIGLVSWGIECAKPDTPGIYTRITSYLDWIAENTKDAQYCQNE